MQLLVILIMSMPAKVSEKHAVHAEAVIFKQFDFRSSSRSRATFHQAFPDPFHAGWLECPPRRSIECRLLLTFDPEPSLFSEFYFA